MTPLQNYHKPIIAILPGVALVIFATLTIRFSIYIWLHRAGYFYGIPWDSFSRTLVSYYWAQNPNFYPADGYWLPAQFWLVGTINLLLKPLVNTSEILIPVAVNNFFLLGSMIITYKFGKRIGGNTVGLLACLLAAIFAGDIFISFTALSEPILVFFLLLASYNIFLYFRTQQPNKGAQAVLIAIPTLLAASTHYIGWFLAIFVCLLILPGLISSLMMKDWKQLSLYTLATLLCVLMPLAWLSHNYFVLGSFFHMIENAKLAQANYIGQIPIMQRLLIPVEVLLSDFPAITIAGLLGVAITAFIKRDALIYLFAPAFVFGLIWLSTILAFSAPYQEPRYLVFWGWASIPFIAFTASHFWGQHGNFEKVLIISIVLLILGINLLDIKNFRNSFNPDVKATGVQARLFLKQYPRGALVLIEDNSYAERGVIPTIAGYPRKVIPIPEKEIKENIEDLNSYFTSYSDPWMAIIKNKNIAIQAQAQGLALNRIGTYYLISPYFP